MAGDMAPVVDLPGKSSHSGTGLDEMYFACVVYTLNYVSEWRTKVIGLFHRIMRDNQCCKRSAVFGRTFDCCFLNPGVNSVMLDKVSPRVHTLVLLSASPYLGAR